MIDNCIGVLVSCALVLGVLWQVAGIRIHRKVASATADPPGPKDREGGDGSHPAATVAVLMFSA
jgi:hypothetical protein